MATITYNCDDVLDFLHAGVVKSPRVIADPLSLHADKRTCVWFRHWIEVNLPTPPKPAPQDHMCLMGVLNDVSTRLHTVEALRPVVATHCEAEK